MYANFQKNPKNAEQKIWDICSLWKGRRKEEKEDPEFKLYDWHREDYYIQ